MLCWGYCVYVSNVNKIAVKAYHHGDLRRELIRIGVQLVGELGPEGVVVREAARRAGVSPSAAYRHFSGQEGLLEAVRGEVLQGLLTHMTQAVEAVPASDPAVGRIVAAGRGYFDFAIKEPKLFQCLNHSFPLREDWAEGGNPFSLLVDLVEQAAVDAGAKHVTDYFAAAVSLWSAVHGISVLSTSGGLRELPEAEQRRFLEGTLQMAVRGLRL